MQDSYVQLSQVVKSDAWPLQVFDGDGTGVLEHLYVSPIETHWDGTTLALEAHLLIDREVELSIAGMPYVSLALSPSGAGTDLPLRVAFTPFEISIVDLPIILRVSGELLRPMKSVTEVDTAKKTTDIQLGKVTIGITGDGALKLDATPQVSLPLCMIGTSGVVVQGGTIAWLTPDDPTPSGASDAPPSGFSGLYVNGARIHLPDIDFLPQTFGFDDCYIGTGGFTGRVSAMSPLTWNAQSSSYNGNLAGELLGFSCGLSRIEIAFERSALKQGSLSGEMYVPYLEKRIGIDLKLSLTGDFALALAAPKTGDPNVTMTSAGLVSLKEPGVLEASLASIGFEKRGDELALRLSGQIHPLIGGIDWPRLDLKALTIYSDGRVDLGGAWLDLPDQKAAGFNGFPLEIRKIGFGSDSPVGGAAVGKSWFGVSGGLKLIDGLPVGGSVEGLKLKWDPTDPANPQKWEIALAGIGVQLDIPDVLKLDGSVAFFDEQGKRWFQGGAKVTLRPLNCSLDAQVLIGRTPQYTFFYIFLEVGLPVGIPLAQTGLALYGMGGLFGYNVRPDRRDGEPWYEGWYKRPPVGPTGAAKWTDQEHKLAFGASVTLGTLPDNGYAVNARVLLILVIPGPIILIEGKANVVKDRAAITASEPLFRALAVIDGEAGTFLLNVEPHFVYAAKGEVIDVTGVAEAFFDFNHSDRWYLNLGVRDPREKRIRATILALFRANAYLMLNAKRVALGFYVGLDQRWTFGPVVVRLAFWFEADAEYVFRPEQLTATAGIHGRAELKAFGLGLALELDAEASVRTPKPFEFSALLHIKADLPWPLPDPQIDLPYEYKEDAPPPLTVPLQSIEVVTRKASESWDVSTNPATPLLVPLDGKPVLVFAKSVGDDAGVGGNIQPVGSERVGQLRFDYRLDSIALDKLEQGSWTTKAGRPTPAGGQDVYGMWMPAVSGDSPPSSKLMLFVKTPFDALKDTATTSAAEEFAQRYPEYPCVVTCVDFEDLPPGEFATGLQHEGLTISYDFTGFPLRPRPQLHDPRGTTGGSHFFPWSQTQTLWIPDVRLSPTLSVSLPAPAHRARVRMTVGGGATLIPYVRGKAQAPQKVPHTTGITDHEITLDVDGIDQIEFDGTEIEVFQICWVEKAQVTPGSPPPPGTTAHNAAEAQRVADGEFMLDPDSTYRLRVKTHVGVSPSLAPAGWQVDVDEGPLGPSSISQLTGQSRYDFEHTVYMRTEGPPGFLSGDIDRRVKAGAVPAPSGAGTPNDARSLIHTLRPYVSRTTPEDGAVAVYRAYDIAVAFNETYVDRMYADSGRDLKLHLADRNGEPPGTRVGGVFTAAPFTAEWTLADDVELTREEQLWSNLLAESECDIPLPPKPHNDVLSGSAAGAVLAPRMTYVATLGPNPPTGATDTVLASFSFTTSAFATFVHHVHSFGGRLWDLDQSRDTPLPALTAGDKSALTTAVQAGDFETLAALFDIGPQQLPDALEVTLVHDAAQPWAFLLESPEPLDAARVRASLLHVSDTSVAVRQDGPVRLRDAQFGDHSGTDFDSEWVDLLVTESTEISGLRLEHLATTADPGTFATLTTITASWRSEPGDVIRVHAGSEPTAGAPADGRLHLYLTAAGDTRSWGLHPGRDVCRLVDASGVEVGRREFHSGFGAVTATWVWNGDRTRAFVLPAAALSGAAQPVPAGTYRIEWRFDRDISATDATQPILRQQGSSAAEYAVTEFSLA